MHEASLRGSLGAVALGVALEQPDPVDHRGRADLVDDHAHVHRLRVAHLAEVAAADLGDHPDRRQRPDVHAGRLREVGVDRGVDQLEVAGVVHVAVDVVIGPAGGRLAPDDVLIAAGACGALGHRPHCARLAIRLAGAHPQQRAQAEHEDEEDDVLRELRGQVDPWRHRQPGTRSTCGRGHRRTRRPPGAAQVQSAERDRTASEHACRDQRRPRPGPGPATRWAPGRRRPSGRTRRGPGPAGGPASALDDARAGAPPDSSQPPRGRRRPPPETTYVDAEVSTPPSPHRCGSARATPQPRTVSTSEPDPPEPGPVAPVREESLDHHERAPTLITT